MILSRGSNLLVHTGELPSEFGVVAVKVFVQLASIFLGSTWEYIGASALPAARFNSFLRLVYMTMFLF